MNHSPHYTFAHYFNDKKLAPFLFTLSKKMQEGNVCIDICEMPTEKEFWEEFGSIDFDSLKFPENTPFVGRTFEENKPFVLDDTRLYIARNDFYESKIVEKLKALAEINSKEQSERQVKLKSLTTFIAELQSKEANLSGFVEDEKPDWQLVAAVQGVLNNLTIVTGGPGTGKTTTVAKILALLNKIEPGLKIALAAPTGKAAMRMKESLQNTVKDERNKKLEIENVVSEINPKTIHRLLGSIHDSPFFKHNAENTLDFDVIIVDEASMIGVGLFAKLLDAIKRGARLILLGDSEQLASVDAGSLFGDLSRGLSNNENKFTAQHVSYLNGFLAINRSLKHTNIFTQKQSFLDEHLIRLKKTYRYEQASQMGQFTKAIINGEAAILPDVLAMEDNSLVLDEKYDEQIFAHFVSGYRSYLEEENIEKALQFVNDRRVLCAVRQGEQGVYAVNKKTEQLLNKKFGLKFKDGFYHNQPIMVTKNMESLNLFNGDVGIVREDANKQLKAYFPLLHKDSQQSGSTTTDEVRITAINPALIVAWETVFAMTIHKSQGSEFDEVLVVLPKQKSNHLLTRELLYTGVTRAKTKAIVQSSLELVQQIATQRVNRVSGIQERIKIN